MEQGGWRATLGRRDGKKYSVEIATGPRETDKRSRHGYVPDREAEQREIEKYLGQGIIYLGDWHTHPQKMPYPSDLDIDTSNDCFRKSKHKMPGYVMIIVGTTRAINDWYVAITTRTGTAQLRLK